MGNFDPADGFPNFLGSDPGVDPPEWSGYSPPWSGVATTEFAVKLKNGAELANSLTVTSDNPPYVQGNYNVVDKRGAAHAIGTWIYGDPVYTAPDRDWALDTDFLDPANLPPGVRGAHSSRRAGSRHLIFFLAQQAVG